MKYNHLISAWLNGYDFSLKRWQGQSFSELIATLGQLAAKRIESMEEFYTSLSYGQSMGAPEEIVVPPPPRITDNPPPRTEFLRPLHELTDYVARNFSREEIVGFYVHGSLSTQDFVDHYSDFDTLLIVKKAVLAEPKWAEDFKRRLAPSNTFLYLLDPLQHHFHFTLTEYDLENYAEAIFPLHLFGFSTELSAFANPIEVRKRDFSAGLSEVIESKKYYFREHWPHMPRMRAYDLKNAIQNIALLPSLFLELKEGKGIYKRESFELARPYFSADQWNVIERAGRVRRECPYRSRYPYAFRKWLGLKVHYKLLSQVHQRFDADNSACMKAIMGPDFLADATKFLVAMEEKAK